jgi:hypothetical protein
MTYMEALAVTGDFTGGKTPPWPPWPPTVVSVEPPPGTLAMRLAFVGQCVSAIEATYLDACEGGITRAAEHRYGPPQSREHGKHLWSDGTREVILVTRRDEFGPTCALTYRLADVALASGQASATHGLAACRAMRRRHFVRWRQDPLHIFQRHALDELGYLLRAD